MLPKDLTHEVKTRLSTIRGQVDGLIKMLDNEDDLQKILNQFKAADAGLDVAYNLLVDEVYRKALAEKIVEVSEACPGNCGNEEKIEYIKKQFPKFHLEEIVKKFKEITKLGEGVKQHKEKNSE